MEDFRLQAMYFNRYQKVRPLHCPFHPRMNVRFETASSKVHNKWLNHKYQAIKHLHMQAYTAHGEANIHISKMQRGKSANAET